MNERLGQLGEALAAEFLISHGYKVLARNYRNRFGEVDIIASHQGAIVFVEVKARSTTRFGTPAEAITRWKLTRLQRLITYFMAHHKILSPVRFEVVVIGEDRSPRLIRDIEFIDN